MNIEIPDQQIIRAIQDSLGAYRSSFLNAITAAVDQQAEQVNTLVRESVQSILTSPAFADMLKAKIQQTIIEEAGTKVRNIVKVSKTVDLPTLLKLVNSQLPVDGVSA